MNTANLFMKKCLEINNMSEIKDKESWHGHTNAEVENYIKNRQRT